MVFPLTLPLVPAPRDVALGEGGLPLLDATRIIGASAHAGDLIAAVAHRTGKTLTALSSGEPATGDIVLRTDAIVGEAEGYLLSVDDVVTITGADEQGLFYGIQTLLQLLVEGEDGWAWARATIADAPRFAHRGVMLDVARHFFPVDEVKTVIDRAAALKFNRLHLHLTDDQGWRLHIESWPLLSEKSSTSAANGDAGGCYSQADYRDIVAYAQSRHVTIIPEIDLPGHTHAIGLAYPEIVEDPVFNDELLHNATLLGQDLPEAGKPYTSWGVGHSSVRIGEEGTYTFIRDVLTELAAMTPGPYIHIGGDESWGTSAEDFDRFMVRVTAMVRELGKTPIAWHEAGAVEDIAEGTVGQFWGRLEPTEAHAAEAAHFVARGGALVLSPADAAYLDMKYDEAFDLGLAWAGHVDVQRAANWEPTEVLDVPESAILGVEAPLWTETVRSLTDAERLMYPRIAAIAEIAWSVPGTDARAWPSLRERLGAMAPLWQADGISFHATDEIPWSAR